MSKIKEALVLIECPHCGETAYTLGEPIIGPIPCPYCGAVIQPEEILKEA
jgi:sarcosine oxidase delta subunit